METNLQKKTLSINIHANLYQRLQAEVGRGRIGRFVARAAEEKLNRQEQELEQAYREISQDQAR
jgi:hypothetical protein